MALTDRIRTGDALDAAEVTANFAALESTIEDVQPSDIERGAIWHRHLTTTESWKVFAVKNENGVVALAAAAIIVPAAPSPYVVVPGQAYVVKATARLVSTGANPTATLSIRLDGTTTVISRRFDLVALSRQQVALAWMAVAGATSMTIELRASGTNCSIDLADLVVLAVRR